MSVSRGKTKANDIVGARATSRVDGDRTLLPSDIREHRLEGSQASDLCT